MKLPTTGQSFVTKRAVHEFIPAGCAAYVVIQSMESSIIRIAVPGSTTDPATYFTAEMTPSELELLLTPDIPIVDRIRACLAARKARI